MKHRLLAAAALAVGAMLHAPAMAAPPPISAYAELSQFDQVELSPDGQHLAALIARGDSWELLLVDGNMKPQKLITLGTAKIRSIRWAGNDKVLVYFHNTVELPFGFYGDKTDIANVIVIPTGAGDAQRVFDNKRGLPGWVMGSYGVRDVGGRPTGFYSTIRFAQDNGKDHYRPWLYAVDLDSMKITLASNAAAEGQSRDWLIGADGKVAALMEEDTDGTWRILDGHNRKIAGGKEAMGRVGLISLGARGDTVIYLVRTAEDAEADWYEVPLSGGAATPFMPEAEIWSIFTDPANGRLIGYRGKDRTVPPVFFDAARNEISKRVLASLGGLNGWLTSWSSDFSKVTVHTSGNGDSGSWYVVDTATMKTVKIGSEHPLIPAEAVGPIRNITYKAKDGTELDGILTLPPDRAAKNLPVMIFPHGGPSSHDIVDFDWWAQAFASRGYAVFQPNFRGSTNKNQAFRAMGNGEWGRKMQTDLSDGLAALAEKGIVDPKRACIMGASYGGYAALAGVTVQNGLYRCAISVAGVSDLKLLYNEENYMNGDTRISRQSLQQQLGDLNLLPDYSPNRLAARADAPILLIHGTDDTVVPYSHSRKMADALAKADKPFQMIDLAAEDHFLSRAPTRLQMLEAAIAFAEKHNPS